MKKLFALTLLSLVVLTACQSKQSQETTTSSSDFQAALAARLEELNQMDFPQLSSQIADNEAAVQLTTNKGDITIKLFPELAPLAVENFLTHAKEGYYDGHIFHRVIKDFMIQGGDPLGNGRGGTSIWHGKTPALDAGNGFRNEPSDLLYNIRGALAMANAGPDTNGSQFFINQNQQDQTSKLHPDYYPKAILEAYKKGGNPSLDGGYTVFGQVTEGMEVVDAIANTETDDQDKPTSDVIIENINVIKDWSFD